MTTSRAPRKIIPHASPEISPGEVAELINNSRMLNVWKDDSALGRQGTMVYIKESARSSQGSGRFITYAKMTFNFSSS